MENVEEKRKGSKLLIIVVVILALAVVGLGGYVVYDKVVLQADDKEVSGKKSADGRDDDDDVEEVEEVLSQSEKDEISTKLSQILFGGRLSSNGGYVTKDDEHISSYNFLIKILTSGAVTDQNKALIALNLVNGNTVSTNKVQKSETEVKNTYKNYFGSDWKDVDLSSLGYCPTYTYDSANKVFVEESGGCGGTTATAIVLHKDDYKIENGIATVDLYAASYTYDMNGGAILSSEFEFDLENMDSNKIINRTNYTDNYILTESDLAKANKYKVSFKKATDGTFYFYSVVKE